MAKRASPSSQKHGVPRGAALKNKKKLQKKAEEKKNRPGTFQPGNQLWQRVQFPGMEKTYPNPSVLWEGCLEYFQWAQDNPLFEQKAFHHRGKVTKTNLNKMRIKTVGSLCLYLGISRTTWKKYRDTPEYNQTCLAAEEYIREDKIAGATAELLNPGFVSLLMKLNKPDEDEDEPESFDTHFEVRESKTEVKVTRGKKRAGSE